MRKILLTLSCILFLVGCSSNANTSSSNPETKNTSGTTESTIVANDLLRVHFIDVGQGDSILIESPNKHYMLIDAGTKGAGQDVVKYLSSLDIEKLDYVVATHPDVDHIGGLIEVLNSLTIDNFIDSGKVHTTATYGEMLALIETKNIPFQVTKTNDEVLLDENLQISVLSANQNAKDNNDASIVLKVVYGEISFLLTGDAGIELEEEMLANFDMRATILKAGHHGSNTSSSLKFVESVHPESTILSYGQDNSYGHPHYEVIQNLKQAGSKIYGTAEAGTIVVETDGEEYKVLADEWTGIGAKNTIVPPKTTESDKDSDSNQSSSDIAIESVDLQGEVVAIKNKGTKDINLVDWQLYSVEGNQMFTFPNVLISSGETIYITSGSDAKEADGYLKWTGKHIWLNSGDTAQLLNPKGEIVSER